MREARFPFQSDLRTPDGGVHDLSTISGRIDAKGCNLSQPDFQGAANNGNLIFRIPTPVFGGGLIEAIPDAAIRANVNANREAKRRMGIGGRPNFGGGGGGGVNGIPNTAVMTAPSRDLAGRRKTSPWKSLPGRLTTWKWA